MTSVYHPVDEERAHVMLIDHYDSFTYNLVQSLCIAGAKVTVASHDRVKVDELLIPDYTHFVISPGPGHPQSSKDFKVCAELLNQLPLGRPILGVCLGFQGIASHLGATIRKAPKVMHGKTSLIMHDGEGLFTDLPSPMKVMRYHSLCVDTKSLPSTLVPTAWCPRDGVLMGIRHRELPVFGVQFHPESIGTSVGDQLLHRFLSL
jgi:anthranilate synthase/aminodeoxychorismate synthase-like glutamine amidotransferase